MRGWFRRGSAENFESIVEQYYEKVFRLAYRMLQSYEEAADVTQDVFLHAYRGWSGFRGESQVYTWLYRITINMCKNRLKQLQRIRRHETQIILTGEQSEGDEGEETHLVEPEDFSNSPETAVGRKELREAIERALNELPLDYRMLITLRDIEGLSYEDIAKILGCTIAAVKAKLFRARTHLREKLRPYLEE
ncbi:MAG: sigma-70 family RNA polymerase sigma factor [Armatimonadota bacterium]|nr:sigma-70 family RNA polymerase sigma factor [Armatimonadota bacterium]MCX7777791.1 sigma-70 family RNA polymerase sigma factor [Armatimonadota bacterium]MDW8025322.1 sigma-70 family RNA polymerase sigma factor [Armatimonadota bacterium]